MKHKVPVRTKIRYAIRKMTGYDVHKATEQRHFLSDVSRLTQTANPVLFDVGSNTGQTIEHLRGVFPSGTIHAFEPSRSTFKQLAQNYKDAGIHLNNIGVASECCSKVFLDSATSEMSSFLETGPDGWGEIAHRYPVAVTTIDTYCESHGIAAIDLLKSDTQGFDLEVLKGAGSMLANTRLVYVEMNIAKLYDGMASFDEIYRFLADRAFEIVGIYETNYRNGLLGWFDALFLNRARPKGESALLR